MLRQLAENFSNLFHDEPRIFRAPGRVNLIGGHIDYNEGFVLPAAIDKSIKIAAAPRSDRKVTAVSLTMTDRIGFDLDDANPQARGNWSDYVRGVAHVLEAAGHRLSGANLLIESNVPVGAGLSSSAALEVASALALTSLSGLEVPLLEIARLCQRAENEFVGARCGIMDQLTSCFGQRGQALLIDCRSLDRDLVPVDESKVAVVVCNTMVKHELAGSEYNTRRAECEQGVRLIQAIFPEVRSLRDVTPEEFERCRDELPDNIRRRIRHFISENQRVLEAVKCLRRSDWPAFGRLMIQSHHSSRDDYQVSCRELDLMVELALDIEGVYGARLTGGGFGGCTVNLVDCEAVEEFGRAIRRFYRRETGLDPDIYACRTASGAGEVMGSEQG